MSYMLGATTLKRPHSFRRVTIEKSAKIQTLDNTTKKDITGRKEQYILGYQFLTQTEMNDILSEYNLMTTRDFSVTETNLTIAATPVHIEIESREYGSAGNEYREDFQLILTEVQ